jgi:hypothetical protein
MCWSILMRVSFSVMDQRGCSEALRRAVAYTPFGARLATKGPSLTLETNLRMKVGLVNEM